MTGYINWHKNNSPIAGDKLQVPGNPTGDHNVVTSGNTATAPAGTQIAVIWCDVASTIEATNLEGESSSYTIALPASTIYPIPNITHKTVITVTDI